MAAVVAAMALASVITVAMVQTAGTDDGSQGTEVTEVVGRWKGAGCGSRGGQLHFSLF